MKRERVFRAKSRAALRQPECTNHGSSVAGRREKQGAFVLGDVATEEARFRMDSPATVHSWERRGWEQGSVSGVGGTEGRALRACRRDCRRGGGRRRRGCAPSSSSASTTSATPTPTRATSAAPTIEPPPPRAGGPTRPRRGGPPLRGPDPGGCVRAVESMGEPAKARGSVQALRRGSRGGLWPGARLVAPGRRRPARAGLPVPRRAACPARAP